MNSLSDNNVLCKFQSVLRQLHSTNSCLPFFHDKITKGFHSGLPVGTFLTDLQNMFDTTDYNILILKIPFQGFTDETIKRYTSYLPKGKFIICIVNAYSDKASIICGVPQSSIFGPPQFLICLNDMTQAVHSGLVRWYTDDTCLVFQHKGTKLIDEPLNQDYSTLVDLFVDKERTFWWGRNKIHSLFSKTYIKINKTNRYLLQGHQNQTYSKVTYLGCVMGIYGNAGLHKNYLKTKSFI